MAQIVVIDDSDLSLNQIKRLLEKNNYTVITFFEGRLGLAHLQTNPPDCLVTDLLMPDFTGLELLQELQALQSNIPVIVLTADVQETTREQCLALGAASVLNKPIRNQELLAAVKGALEQTESAP